MKPANYKQVRALDVLKRDGGWMTRRMVSEASRQRGGIRFTAKVMDGLWGRELVLRKHGPDGGTIWWYKAATDFSTEGEKHE